MSAIPAFPTQNGCRNDPGLTKREWFAGMALQGILANRRSGEQSKAICGSDSASKAAVKMGDAMLAALGKEEG